MIQFFIICGIAYATAFLAVDHYDVSYNEHLYRIYGAFSFAVLCIGYGLFRETVDNNNKFRDQTSAIARLQEETDRLKDVIKDLEKANSDQKEIHRMVDILEIELGELESRHASLERDFILK